MKKYTVPIAAITGSFFILMTVPALAQTSGTGGPGSYGTGSSMGGTVPEMSPGMAPGPAMIPETSPGMSPE